MAHKMHFLHLAAAGIPAMDLLGQPLWSVFTPLGVDGASPALPEQLADAQQSTQEAAAAGEAFVFFGARLAASPDRAYNLEFRQVISWCRPRYWGMRYTGNTGVASDNILNRAYKFTLLGCVVSAWDLLTSSSCL